MQDIGARVDNTIKILRDQLQTLSQRAYNADPNEEYQLRKQLDREWILLLEFEAELQHNLNNLQSESTLLQSE